MRIGVIRGDLPGPIFLSNLEPSSQFAPSIEPRGQALNLNRPTTDGVEAAMADVAPTVQSVGSITFPLTIDGTNKVLKLRLAASGAYTTVTLAEAAYANITTLAAAVNVALAAASLDSDIIAEQGSTSLKLRLRALTELGVGATLETGTTGGGSTFNVDAGFEAAGKQTTIPTAATVITALLPVAGPLDVSDATILATINAYMTSAQLLAVADAIAPQIFETSVARDSGYSGQISWLLSASYTPDSRRVPALPTGAAITVVTDDGTTVETFSTLPTTSSCVLDSPTTGDVTITGTNLGSVELQETVVSFTGSIRRTLPQGVIEGAGGSVSATSIVVPASLIPGATLTTTIVRVQKRSYMSATRVLT